MKLAIDAGIASAEGRDPQRWCFISGRISALETTMLRNDFFQRLSGQGGMDDMLSCLRDSPLRDFFHTTDDVVNFEEILNNRYLAEMQETRKFSPVPAVCDFFLIPFDFINLKNFIKEDAYGLPPVKRFPGTVRDDAWRELWEGMNPALPGVYKDAVSALKRTRTGPGEAGADDPGLVDSILDGYLLRYLPTLMSDVRSELIREYVNDYLRLKVILMLQRIPTGREAAMLWFLRGDEFFESFLSGPPRHWREALLEIVPEGVVERIIAGNRDELLLRYEKHTGDYLMEKLERARCVTFGPERVFGYLSGLSTELYNLRLLIGSKLNKLNPQVVRGMLRRAYV